MLVGVHTEWHAIECERDLASGDVGRYVAMSDGENGDVVTLVLDSDTSVKSDHVDGEGEGKAEACLSIPSGGHWGPFGGLSEVKLEILQLNRLDNLKVLGRREQNADTKERERLSPRYLAIVQEKYSRKRLDTLLKPRRTIRPTSSITINSQIRLNSVHVIREHRPHIQQSLVGAVLRNEAPSERELGRRLREERERVCRRDGPNECRVEEVIERDSSQGDSDLRGARDGGVERESDTALGSVGREVERVDVDAVFEVVEPVEGDGLGDGDEADVDSKGGNSEVLSGDVPGERLVG